MKKNPPQAIVLLLTFLFVAPMPHAMAFGQQAGTDNTQEKPQAESPEAKKIRERDESLKKKEDERKGKEAKARATEAKKYQTLSEFAEDLYASDPDFRDQVDDAYLHLQATQASEAHRINISHRKELLATE